MFGNLDDPQRIFSLMLGAGLLSPVRNKGFAGFGEALGQGIQGGLLGYNKARQMQDQRGQDDMRRKFQEAQLSQMNQANADRDFMRQSAGQFFQPSNAPADGMGPVSPPKMDFAGYGQALASRGMVNEAIPFMPKPEAPKAPIKLGQNERLIDPNTHKEMVSAAPENWQNPEWVKTQMAIRAAGKPQVTTNVMPPREVFKDSMTLKKDFDGQPEVKGFKEVQGAWDQISTALKRPSAANDMAAATKFMKLLDPGSVVRESELMMAMQASGAFDRMANYHKRLMRGEKLTPNQREDFYKSGEALYGAAKSRYDQTVGQYEELAGKYSLDADFLKPKNAAGAPKIGTVDGDYYFKGGDPADPKSWVKRK